MLDNVRIKVAGRKWSSISGSSVVEEEEASTVQTVQSTSLFRPITCFYRYNSFSVCMATKKKCLSSFYHKSLKMSYIKTNLSWCAWGWQRLLCCSRDYSILKWHIWLHFVYTAPLSTAVFKSKSCKMVTLTLKYWKLFNLENQTHTFRLNHSLHADVYCFIFKQKAEPLFAYRYSDRDVLPWHNSCCWPWWVHGHEGKYTLPTSHWPVQHKEREGRKEKRVTLLDTVIFFKQFEADSRPSGEERKGEELFLTHIVGGPPGLEFEVPLQSGSQVLLKVFSQALHPFVPLIFHQRAHWLQVLSTQRNA